MKLTDYYEKLRSYVFHGVEINNDPTQSTGSCPFCDATSKFSIKTETGQYRCLRCEETGNAYSFMFRLHQLSLSSTKKEDYQSLVTIWNVTPASLQYFGLAKSRLTNEWLIPAYNAKGNLANLYRITTRKDEQGNAKQTPMGTPGCKPQPFATNHVLTEAKPTLIMVEGVKDGCALYDALISHAMGHAPSPKGERAESTIIKAKNPEGSLFATNGILAVPGCGNVSPDWFSLLQNKQVWLWFDNDHPKRYGPDHEKSGELIKTRGELVRPGWDGMKRIVTLLGKSKERPKELHLLHWEDQEGHSPNLSDGFDIRDLIKRDGHRAALLYLFGHSRQTPLTTSIKKSKKEEPANAITPIERTTFDSLCTDWKSVLHFTQELEDTLAIMLAVILSTESEKTNHIWLRVIGPPGSGKSTLAEAISVAREWVSPKSIVTGFHSGFVDPESEESASLIPQLDCKTVVMKDGDTLVNSPNRDRILAELRDLYDGTSRAHYRNMKSDEFEDVRMTFILCGTDELRSLNRTFLGERFLDCEIMKRGEDTSPYLQRAVSNTYAALLGHLSPKEEAANQELSEATDHKDRMLFLKRVTYGFVKYLKEKLKAGQFTPPELSPETDTRLQAMGQFVSYMRARAKDNHDETAFRPRAELATRLCSQLTKLSFFLALVLGRPRIDDAVLRLVLKVVLDTALGLRFEAVSRMAAEEFLGIRQLSLELDKGESTIRRLLEDMRTFDIAKPMSVNNNSGQRGRDRHLWQLTPNMLSLWKQAILGEPVSPIPPKKGIANARPNSKGKRVYNHQPRHKSRSS